MGTIYWLLNEGCHHPTPIASKPDTTVPFVEETVVKKDDNNPEFGNILYNFYCPDTLEIKSRVIGYGKLGDGVKEGIIRNMLLEAYKIRNVEGGE